jgi:hypothetical protein
MPRAVDQQHDQQKGMKTSQRPAPQDFQKQGVHDRAMIEPASEAMQPRYP